MELELSPSTPKSEKSVAFEGVSPFYCDYNATTPMPTILTRLATKAHSSHWFNLSAPYGLAEQESQWLDKMRSRFSALSGDQSAKTVFCASSTEAINQAIYSLSINLGDAGRIIISDIEHSAVRAAAARWFPERVLFVTAEKMLSGDYSEIAKFKAAEYPMASVVQAGNNETGVLLPLSKIKDHLPESCHLIVDASQIMGKCDDFLEDFSIADGVVVSPHKFYGPKGVGVLIWKEKLGTLQALVVGGGQEHGFRSGTENTPALFLTNAWLQSLPQLMEAFAPIEAFKESFESCIVDLIPSARIVGKDFTRLKNTSAVCIPGVLSDHLVPALDFAGVMASSGSACNHGTQEPSKSYLALGLSWEDARCVIRFSFGCPNLTISPEALAAKVSDIAKKVSGK